MPVVSPDAPTKMNPRIALAIETLTGMGVISRVDSLPALFLPLFPLDSPPF